MGRWKRSALLAAAAMLGIAAAANARVGLGTLGGTVMDHKGKPVAGASVTIQTSDGRHPHVTTTNEQGRFFFPELIHGLYDVRAYSNGRWTEWKHNTTVRTGKQTEVKLRLPPPASQSVAVPRQSIK
jgi:hypothetical protein